MTSRYRNFWASPRSLHSSWEKYTATSSKVTGPCDDGNRVCVSSPSPQDPISTPNLVQTHSGVIILPSDPTQEGSGTQTLHVFLSTSSNPGNNTHICRQTPSTLWAWDVGPTPSHVRQQPDSSQGDAPQMPATWAHTPLSTFWNEGTGTISSHTFPTSVSPTGPPHTSDPQH